MIDEERQQRDRTIAERYALQHRHDAQIPQSPVASYYVAQPVYAESDKEYQDGALRNLPRLKPNLRNERNVEIPMI